MKFQEVYKPLKILNFASLLQYQRFVMPVSFLFYIYNGLSFSDFILFQSIFNITCLIMKIPMGFLGDIFSKKYILISSYFLFMLRVVLWIFFKGFWIVLFGEILYGAFKALYRGNVDSYIYEYLKSNNIQKAILPKYANLSFYTSLGSAISCILGVILYKNFGFKIILYIELVMQFFAIFLLFLLPDTKAAAVKNSDKKISEYFSDIIQNLIALLKNKNINYYIFYSAMVTGLTGVFVWNFQPLLKLTLAPIILFGIVSFTNQMLRAAGGIFANKFIKLLNDNILIKIEYFAVLISFLALIFAYGLKSYVSVSILILIVCLAICLYVIFNIYTVAKIHENVSDIHRATMSSTNTFLGDFASFFLLLSFKFIYDLFDIKITLLIFFILFLIILFPYKRVNETV